MKRKKLISRKGLTLTELIIAVTVSTVVAIVAGVVLVDGHRCWARMYSRTYSDVATDTYVARKTFDAVVRKASRQRHLLDEAGKWVEVYYHASDASTVPDCYARFFLSGDRLCLEDGRLNPRETSSVKTVCKNVSNCTFKAAGRSVQMILTLDDRTQTATVTASAVMHN
jgi:hypothetical protein